VRTLRAPCRAFRRAVWHSDVFWMFDIVSVNLFEYRTLTRIYFCTLRMASRKAETYIKTYIDIINYINWLRSVNCGIALISPSKIDWLLIEDYSPSLVLKLQMLNISIFWDVTNINTVFKFLLYILLASQSISVMAYFSTAVVNHVA